MAAALAISQGIDAIVHLGGYAGEGPWKMILSPFGVHMNASFRDRYKNKAGQDSLPVLRMLQDNQQNQELRERNYSTFIRGGAGSVRLKIACRGRVEPLSTVVRAVPAPPSPLSSQEAR